MRDVHELGDDGQAGGLLGLQQQADALLPQTLEVVGGGAGLEGAPPEEGRPGLLHLLGHEGDLLLGLHGAGAGDEAKCPPPMGGGAGLDDGILGMELPVDRLKGLGHPGDRHPSNVQALDHLHVHLGGVADEAQDGLVLPPWRRGPLNSAPPANG